MQTKHQIDEATNLKEHANAVNDKSAMVLLITASGVTEFALSARCGIVSIMNLANTLGHLQVAPITVLWRHQTSSLLCVLSGVVGLEDQVTKQLRKQSKRETNGDFQTTKTQYVTWSRRARLQSF